MLHKTFESAGRTTYGNKDARKYRSDIDGIRAIAVSSVVFYHSSASFLPSGYVGVDIFFVISGFLIGGILYRETRSSFSFQNFYARRAKRILPALMAVCLASLLVASLLLSPKELSGFSLSTLSALLGISNIRFWLSLGYFTPDAEMDPFLMTWSLGVEEQFYVFFPLILLLLRNSREKNVILWMSLLSLLSLILSIFLTYNYPLSAFYLLPARAWEMGIGAILAIVLPKLDFSRATREVLAALGLLAICLSMVVFDAQTPFPGLAVLLPVLGTLLVIATPGSFSNRVILGARPVVGIGLISYSWYLWHWPIMAFARICSVGEPSHLVMLGCVALSFVLAALSWRFVERPFRTSPAPNSQILRRYGLALCAILALPLALWLGRGFPSRASAEVIAVDAAVNRTRHDTCLIDGGDTPNLSSSCVNISNHPSAIAIIGDSHAAALATGMKDVAVRAGQGYAILTKASCKPFLDVRVTKNSNPRFSDQCRHFMIDAFAFIEKQPAIRTVMLAGLWEGPIRNPDEKYVNAAGGADGDQVVLFKRGLLQSVRHLERLGKTVIIVQDTPYWSFDPAQAIRVRYTPLRASVQRIIDDKEQDDFGLVRQPQPGIDESIAQVSQLTGARTLNTKDHFCAGARCRYAFGGQVYFSDRSHLSEFGAIEVIKPNLALLAGR